jgi:hypothetical protein
MGCPRKKSAARQIATDSLTEFAKFKQCVDFRIVACRQQSPEAAADPSEKQAWQTSRRCRSPRELLRLISNPSHASYSQKRSERAKDFAISKLIFTLKKNVRHL